ncbi:MAG: response regulator [Fimbriimonadaceae bacterium]|nr:response regulator [Fimbriimonadaceae bacterium]
MGLGGVWLAVAGLLGTHLLLELLLHRGARAAALASEAWILLASAIATGLLWPALAALPADEVALRRSWRRLAWGQTLITAGHLGHLLWVVGQRATAGLGPADWGYLLGGACFVAGLLSLPAMPLLRREEWKLLLDLGIVTSAVLCLFWIFLIAPTLDSAMRGAALAKALIYPVVDLALLFAAMAVILHPARQQDRRPMLAISTAVVCGVVADVCCLAAGLRADAGGSRWGELLLTASATAALVAAAFLARHQQFERPLAGDPAQRSPSRWTSLVPYFWAGTAYVLSEWSQRQGSSAWSVWLETSVALVMVLVVVRQVLAIEENGRLFASAQREIGERRRVERELRQAQESLEERIAERTAELAEANEKLAGANRELRETQQRNIQQERLRALGTMASGVAHDFNNALTPILGASELLLLQPGALRDADRVRRNLTMIAACAQDAAAVVARLREFYRHRDPSELTEPVDLAKVLEESLAVARPRWKDQAQAAGWTIAARLECSELPPFYGQAPALREALVNLVVNAADAIQQRPSEDRTGLIVLSASQDGDDFLLTVRDDGVGMSEETRLHCFEPFYSTKGERGTGLGLAMVYGIVQRHAGSIEVTSLPGRGTCFELRLPATQPVAPPIEGPVASTNIPAPRRILVIDDEPWVREVIVEYLELDGHLVEAATNGREGLEAFQAGAHDVVITDRAMPVLNGDQVAATIKSLAPQTPVVLLTGFGELMQANGELPHGVEVVAGKPITIQGLRDCLARAIALQALPSSQVSESPAISLPFPQSDSPAAAS